MESYFAETLKCLYLLFAPPETLDFKGWCSIRKHID